MSAGGAIRVAIVGCGPKGFGCLERLAIETRRRHRPRPLHVTLHDPIPDPGAGVIYDAAQPGHLSMNFAARNIDIWSRDAAHNDGAQRPDLLSWLEANHPAWANSDAFIPRRLVGEYLHLALQTLLDSLPPELTVTPVPGAVIDVQRNGSGWSVRHANPSFDRHVDEVMITLGHGTWQPSPQWWPGGDDRSDTSGTGVISPVYPVARQLDVARVPPRSTVGMRGFALSWIDATLTLTVGRGGRFEEVGALEDGAGRYVPSGNEVARILPFSRTGDPLLAKPGPALVARSTAFIDGWDRLRRQIRSLSREDPLPGLRRALGAAADGALERCAPAGRAPRAPAIEALLASDPPTNRPVSPDPGAASLMAMRRAVAVATSRRPPDPVWAVGEAWRQGYPAIVGLVSHGGLPVADRARFDALAARLERLAFGAPAANLQRMILLAESGRVDLHHLRAPRLCSHDRGLALVTGPRRTAIDVLVDAVTTPPGVTNDTPLWGSILGRGQARIARGTRAIEITADATCIDRRGRRTAGLAAIGRATEGWILGNDTLNRTLHHETRRWARRVVHEPVSASLPSGRRPTALVQP